MSDGNKPWKETDFSPGDRIIVGTNPGHSCIVVSSGLSGDDVVLIIGCEEGRGELVYPNREPIKHSEPKR